MSVTLPTRGFVFWPVGTGDSTTIVIDDGVVMQVDLRHMESSNEEEDPHYPVIDHLEELLPEVDGKPYLAVFALTHPDQDHCQGFADLLKRVTIGELWFTPRVFREYSQDLCEDAQAFRKEAKRRVAKAIAGKGEVGAGDRVRIVGYDDILKEDDYKGFPEDRLTVPGDAITEVDGADVSDHFRGFVHAPFKDDAFGDRNTGSLGLQVTLIDGEASIRALLLGDLAYPTIKNILDRSDAEDLAWNLLLAPHHCSKSVMYWKDEEDEEETLRQEILDGLEEAAEDVGYIISSSDPVPATNKDGDNPPHAKAKRRYEDIVPNEFICTQEHPDEKEPTPFIAEIQDESVEVRAAVKGAQESRKKDLSSVVAAARGSDEPPKDRVGFGKA